MKITKKTEAKARQEAAEYLTKCRAARGERDQAYDVFARCRELLFADAGWWFAAENTERATIYARAAQLIEERCERTNWARAFKASVAAYMAEQKEAKNA